MSLLYPAIVESASLSPYPGVGVDTEGGHFPAELLLQVALFEGVLQCGVRIGGGGEPASAELLLPEVGLLRVDGHPDLVAPPLPCGGLVDWIDPRPRRRVRGRRACAFCDVSAVPAVRSSAVRVSSPRAHFSTSSGRYESGTPVRVVCSFWGVRSAAGLVRSR